MSEEKVNIVDKVTDDSTKIVITTRSVKWIIGILSGAVLGILGFAWGLYIKVDGKVDEKFKDLDGKMSTNTTEIIRKMEELDKNKVEKNKEKNFTQDIDIVRLYERVDSRNNRINSNVNRPTITDTSHGPSFGN